MELKHGDEFTDGMYNFIVVRADGVLIAIDAEGCKYPESEVQAFIGEYQRVDPEMSGEQRIARWLATPGAPALPI